MPNWKQLPALRTLRAFESAARHLNYTRAAAELHQTHGAISHQMRALEESLGARLFHRVGRQTCLTDNGRQLAQGVRDALDALASVIARVSERDADNSLTVSVLPSFAAAWLVGRLGAFLEQHPQIQFNLRSSSALADFRSDGVDVAIRFGRGPWPDTVTEKLSGDELFPVMSPGFLKNRRLKKPADLLKLPLLHTRATPWLPWFEAAGVKTIEPRGPSYDDSELALQAATQGQGIALGRTSLVSGRLGNGSLIAPFALRIPSPSSYFLVYPEASTQKAAFRIFREWIFDQIRA